MDFLEYLYNQNIYWFKDENKVMVFDNLYINDYDITITNIPDYLICFSGCTIMSPVDKLPNILYVIGSLVLEGCCSGSELPKYLAVSDELYVTDMDFTYINLNTIGAIHVALHSCNYLKHLEGDCDMCESIVIACCESLKSIGSNITTRELHIRSCNKLVTLGEELTADIMFISSCAVVQFHDTMRCLNSFTHSLIYIHILITSISTPSLS